ncbi:hypothetical protein [Nocardiopsis sp. CNT312]|uniref:hypothetical protein n=1 Tax=Nocardiopsis sp. CNT312 TaxID=1137268 RepID=UPI0006880A9D|nr:hypothetical protein [Nocardiopsis sp. CNT312]
MDDVPWAFEARGSAWVESPLQFLAAVEAYASGDLSTHGIVMLRQDAPGLSAIHAELRRLHPAVQPAALARRPARPRSDDYTWVLGDPFSGRVQRALLKAARCRLVLVDDGVSLWHLLRLLSDPSPRALVRARVRRTLPRIALGRSTARVLRTAAAEGRLTVFTMLPLPEDLLSAAEASGIRVVRHDFPLLRSLPEEKLPDEERIVLGTALVNDGLLRMPAYLSWVGDQTARGTIAYYPHRREDPRVLARLAEDGRVRLVKPGLPVELALRGLGSGHEIRSLPSTALVALRRLVRGASVGAQEVADGWWTRSAPRRLRSDVALTASVVNEGERAGGV